MEKKDKIKNLKAFKNILTMSSLSIVLALTGCSKEDKSFKDTLDENKNNTYLDEFIKENKSNIIEEVTILEEYIKLSNKFNESKIEKMYITSEQLKESTLLKPTEIKELIFQYTEDSKDEETLYQLNVQRKLVDNFIVTEGYRISADLNILILKIKLAESYGLPFEITSQIVDNIKIPSSTEMNYDNSNVELHKDTIKIGKYNILIDNEQQQLLKKIYELQQNMGNNNYEYNQDRNNMITSAINSGEKMIPKNYLLKIRY